MSELLAPLGDGLAGRVGELAGAMRAQGSRVGVGEVLAAHRALAVIDPASREDARLALRSVLCSTRVDLERFEVAFYAVFGDGRPLGADDSLTELGAIERAALPQRASPIRPAAPRPSDERDAGAGRLERGRAAAREGLRPLHAGRGAGGAGADRAARAPRPAPAARGARVRRAGAGHAPDLRATVRESLRTGGEPLHRRWRAPTTRPRPVVLVCDVSGSMAPYARMLLQYMHACVAARRRVEAFAFGTRLTRITNELNGRDHDLALERAAAAVIDFSGGTRIGAALAELNRVHGRRLGRGAVVVILSDGWDRGDPELLESEMARLRRSAHRLVWLNPLAAHPDYEPLTRGMRAAVPHTDELLAGNSLASLEQLAEILEEM